MAARSFSVILEGQEAPTLVLAVSADLTHILTARNTPEGPRLVKIPIEQCLLAGVYFGVDDSTWSNAFLKAGGS